MRCGCARNGGCGSKCQCGSSCKLVVDPANQRQQEEIYVDPETALRVVDGESIVKEVLKREGDELLVLRDDGDNNAGSNF